MLSDDRPMDHATVVGAGLMGRRIAGVLSRGGLDVRIFDARAEALPEAVDAARAMGGAGRVEASSTLAAAVEGTDIVVEAVVEDLAVKQQLFCELDALTTDAVLASNTSVLPIGDIAARAERRGRVVGTHWWNPPDLVPVVEVVQGPDTDPQVVDAMMTLLERLGKLPVHVRRDTPGFIGNRLQHALWREALALVSEGVADPVTVDLVARNTIGLRLAEMGPIENADYVGLDLTRAIHAHVLPALSPAVAPDAGLVAMVDRGQLGAKTGSGYLAWPVGRRARRADQLATHVSRGLSTTHQHDQESS